MNQVDLQNISFDLPYKYAQIENLMFDIFQYLNINAIGSLI